MPAVNPNPKEIREARVQLLLSRREAADLIHMTERAWIKYESGERRMHPQHWTGWKVAAGLESRIPRRIHKYLADDGESCVVVISGSKPRVVFGRPGKRSDLPQLEVDRLFMALRAFGRSETDAESERVFEIADGFGIRQTRHRALRFAERLKPFVSDEPELAVVGRKATIDNSEIEFTIGCYREESNEYKLLGSSTSCWVSAQRVFPAPSR